MPLEPELGTPVEWLRRAKSNLIRAKQPRLEGVFWEDLCFDAQQAVEKALKGLLTFYSITLEKLSQPRRFLVAAGGRAMVFPSGSSTILRNY
jgi:HEPN domain-containing protein